MGHFATKERKAIGASTPTAMKCVVRGKIRIELNEGRGHTTLANLSGVDTGNKALYLLTCVLDSRWKELVEHSALRSQSSSVSQGSKKVKKRPGRPKKLLPGITLNEFVQEHYLKGYLWATSRATERTYEFLLRRHVIPALGHRCLADIRFEEVQSLAQEHGRNAPVRPACASSTVAIHWRCVLYRTHRLRWSLGPFSARRRRTPR
jgi:hypothetical protein